MKLEDIKIESIKKIDRIVPKECSGTGYCEYIQLFIEFNNHLSKTILLPDWYTDLSTQIKDFKIEMGSMLTLGYYVIIDDEVINTLIDIINESHKEN
jgi:hypothetical protein